jgi:hypothetical protein
MKIPSEFDRIRPFEPEELPEAYDRLLGDAQFRQVIAYLYPDVPFDALAQKMRACKTNLEFQKAFPYHFLGKLLAQASKGCDMDVSEVDVNGRYTFVSNHRDIVLDSALLDRLLIDSGFTTTCEIAIGDNLLSLPWVRDLVRVNKSFIVERSLHAGEMLRASKRMAEYMHFAISEKNENIWIAQREGRAKDSDDRTQPAILKMMAMGGEGSLVERLSQLHIVPLAISYEFDPCDYLKAREFQLKRDNPEWKKSAQDDIDSMRTGIMGYKGHIHYHCAPCIDPWLHALDTAMPKNKLFDLIATHIDHEIHRNYRLYPCNYIAAHVLDGDDALTAYYTDEEEKAFLDYVERQIAKIHLEGKDEGFLRERLLTMYANPYRNWLKAQ